nr:hypothetical protein [Amycolatopsis sp. MEP2-6]
MSGPRLPVTTLWWIFTRAASSYLTSMPSSPLSCTRQPDTSTSDEPEAMLSAS